MRYTPSRKINYQEHQASFNGLLMRLMQGIKADRVNALTRKQILDYLAATPREWLSDRLDQLLYNDMVRIARTTIRGDRYVYELTEAGARTLFRMENPNI